MVEVREQRIEGGRQRANLRLKMVEGTHQRAKGMRRAEGKGERA